MSRRIVIALGGNALQNGNDQAAPELQKQVARNTVRRLVPLIKRGYQLVLVHGNGPQVGNIIIHEEAINTASTPTYPVDTCGAMSQGAIGYWLQQAFAEEFARQHMNRTAVTVIAQSVVNPEDPAFSSPSKPIGPFYATKEEADKIALEKGYVVKEDAGRGWRRVVPSPKPEFIIEKDAIITLIEHNVTVITAGGGGVPVTQTGQGIRGVEGVIDKDHSAAIMADLIGADSLIILTSVDAAMINYREPNQEVIHDIDTIKMKSYVDAGYFAAGSMLPKVQSALKFLEKPNRKAVIASLNNVVRAVQGLSGTVITS